MIPPIGLRPTLTVVSNADGRFFPGLAVAIASAIAAASGDYDYEFLILDGGIDESSLSSLRETVSTIASRRGVDASISRLMIDQTRLSALPERRGSRMTYAKLVLPEALSHLDSIIYLDADVLCFCGVESVQPPVGETEWLLAGARDFFSVIEKDCPWLDQVPVPERRLPYINCGVMWMNLKDLRGIDFTARSIAARASIGQARQGDQSVFNFLCRGKSFILPDSINHRTAIGSSRVLCEGNLDLNLHYIGSPKPWLGKPKTSNWLADRLWHQARAALFHEAGPAPTVVRPHDERIIRGKSWLYALTNPRRAAHYCWDLRSLEDPCGILKLASRHWISRT